MPTPPDRNYVAVIKIERVTHETKNSSLRNGYGTEQVTERTVETFRVPAVRAKDLDRLREKLAQYLELVTDEDFGDHIPRQDN